MTVLQSTRRVRRYRFHEVAFDATDAGHTASCSCGWPAGRPKPFLDVDDAHYAGAEHLARMAYRRLALRHLVNPEAPVAETLWSALRHHRDRLGDEAQAVVDLATEAWPDRTSARGG